MRGKTVILRERAARDVDEALAHYSKEAGEALALDFVDELEAAVLHIGAHPGTGSPRYAVELDLENLRSWPTRRFPYVIFYVEKESDIDVWRVLHAHRDIPAWLATS